MANPILISESFERAAYSLQREMEMATPRLQEAGSQMQAAADSFRESVDRLARVLGMHAENMQRAHRGESMAFTEGDFL